MKAKTKKELQIIKCKYPWQIDNECSPDKTYNNWTVDTEVCRKRCPKHCKEYNDYEKGTERIS